MVCAAFSEGRSMIHRLDPRVRIAFLALFAVLVAASTRLSVAGFGVAIGTAAVVVARLDALVILRRMVVVNVFMLILVLVLPLTMPGEPVATVGAVAFSAAGVHRAVGIALKANAVVLVITGLLSTMHLVTAGHALGRMGAPRKLVHLFFFTVRYSDVLHHEYARLRRTLRVRGFRPGANRHTYRTYGYLLGMLLVRSFDRSHRILSAMKCRGFTGRFPAIDRMALRWADGVFAAVGMVFLAAMAAVEWQWIS